MRSERTFFAPTSVHVARAAVALSLVLGVAGCGASDEPAEAAAAPAARPPALVAAEPVRGGTLTRELRYFAEARPVHQASLSPSAPGEVISVEVREGSHVREGDVLMRVNGRQASAQLAQLVAQHRQAEITLVQAQRDAERAARLSERSIASGQAAEQAQAQAEALSDQVEAARAGAAAQHQMVQDHVVRAPFDGVISMRAVDPGDFVSPGVIALELMSAGEVEIFARVPESALTYVAEGTEVRVEGATPGGSSSAEHVVAGVVVGVVGALDPATRSALVRIRPSAPAPWLRAGSTMYVIADQEIGGDDVAGVIVSRDALVYGPASQRVVKLVDGHAQLINVYVANTSETEALVVPSSAGGETPSLAVGDLVIVSGNERLRPQQPVALADSAPATGDAGDAGAEEAE